MDKEAKQMQIRIRSYCLFGFIGLMLVAGAVSASSFVEANRDFPLPARFSADAYSSDYTVGQADLMLPLVGDDQHNFYLDPNVAYGSDNQGYADLGLGYRWIKNDVAIFGLYVFGGYTRIDNNARLWVANPGIEVLGSRWDAHLNGYFPMGDRNRMITQSSSTVESFRFSEHSEFLDTSLLTIQQDQHAGNGADIKVGYQLFPSISLKGYLGSYFFKPAQTSKIWGGAAGLEYWLDSHIKFFANYTLDNLRHSTGALGLGIELGGTHNHRTNPSLEERITDSVERYLAELGHGSAIPSRIGTQPTLVFGSSQLFLSNIAFFSPTGDPPTVTLASCTFENPCGPADFTQDNVDTLSSLLPNTVFYFSGGSYPALDDTGINPITLNANQSLYSRTADYLQPATGDARATFNGAFILSNNNTLENIILMPTANTISGAAILTTNANNVLVTGSQLGNSSNLFTFAVLNTGAGSTTIENSELFSNFIAVLMSGSTSSGSFTMQNSIINVISSSNAAGLTSQGTNSLSVSNSQINLTGVTGTSAALDVEGNSTLIANNVAANVTSSSPNNVFAVYMAGNGTLQFNNGQINVVGQAITSSSSGTQFNNSTCILNGSTVGC
jgi:hypothetical protein